MIAQALLKSNQALYISGFEKRKKNMSFLSGKRICGFSQIKKIVFLFLLAFFFWAAATGAETKPPIIQVQLRDGIVIESGPKPYESPKASSLFLPVSNSMRLKTLNTSIIDGNLGGRVVQITWDSILSDVSEIELMTPGLSPYKKGRITIKNRKGEKSELTGATFLKYIGHDAPVKEFIIYSYDGFNKSWREENLDIAKVRKISIISQDKTVSLPLPQKHEEHVVKPKTVSCTVRFEPGMNEVAAEYQKKLRSLAETAKSSAYKGRKIYVTGHTDYDKDKKRSLETGKKRAEAVKDFLVKKAGVPASRIKVSSMGDKKPVASNKKPEGRSKNRRVEVVVK